MGNSRSLARRKGAGPSSSEVPTETTQTAPIPLSVLGASPWPVTQNKNSNMCRPIKRRIKGEKLTVRKIALPSQHHLCYYLNVSDGSTSNSCISIPKSFKNYHTKKFPLSKPQQKKSPLRQTHIFVPLPLLLLVHPKRDQINLIVKALQQILLTHIQKRK